LPAYDPEVPGPVEHYLAAVSEVVRPFNRWRIRPFLTLAAFSFARIAMYQDLDAAKWPAEAGGPETHPLVKPMLRAGADDGENIGASFADEYEIDLPEVERLAPILLHDADSSQHSAIIDAMQGRNLVIEGPPGTGKSQTIANLIANVVHRGGAVLFVSEKMAALDVVKSRLERVGLGDFCLALHSTGAKPAAVIQALRKREAMPAPHVRAAEDVDAQARRAKQELGTHIRAMHETAGPRGETVHALIGRLAELARVLPRLPAMLRGRALEFPHSLTAVATMEARERLEALEAAAAAPERPDWNPAKSRFKILDRADLFPDEQESLLVDLGRIAAEAGQLESTVEDLAARFANAPPATLSTLRNFLTRVDALPDPGELVDRTVLRQLSSPDLVRDLAWIADAADVLQTSAARLSATGLGDPAAARPDNLSAAVEVARRLGLMAERVGDVAGHAQSAKAATDMLSENGRIAAELAAILLLGDDPDCSALRLACGIPGLAAEVDPNWLQHRRPGLERHLSVLEEATKRQAAIEERARRIAERLDLVTTTAIRLRTAAASLRGGGLFDFMRRDVTHAKRLFTSSWRSGSLPRRSDWAAHLEEAAAVAEAIESFRLDKAIRAALGFGADPLGIPLRQITLAADWQRRVGEVFSGEDMGTARLRDTFLALDEASLLRVAALAGPARALRATLEEANVGGGQSWAALCRAKSERAEALGQLARLLTGLGLRPEVALADLEALAECAEWWRRASVNLASKRAQSIRGVSASSAQRLRATAAFAASLYELAPAAAATLLADGWSDAVAVLRASAERAKVLSTAFAAALSSVADLGLHAFAQTAPDRPFKTVRAGAEELLSAATELPAYLSFATTRAACAEHAMAGPVLVAFEAAGEPLAHLPEALDWLVAWAVVRRHAEGSRAIFNRSGVQLSVLRQSFASADIERKRLDAIKVAAAARRRPVPRGSSAGSRREWTDGALLQNEFAKQSRHIPVRDLLGRAGDAVLALTPCLMMSPLTVAQYLRPGRIAFDLVVMDEASQIKPEDALGALLRGRQTVIVGDPKQLPPTSFFDRALDDGDGSEGDDEQLSADDMVVAESVLDLAIRAFRPARRLRWHYRSQHESLIAFSNRAFYDDNLVIFPSAQAPSETLGIEFVQVHGRWSERVNAEEASAVADAVARFMHRHPELSHGVVSMNQPQRELIEAEIDRLTAGDSEAARYREIWEEKFEPPFVKNLENVQGDERDVIFISLGWGRTPTGAWHQRFFPVNRREDGHRRLNVLFTRAKRKVVLFSSLQPEDIVVDPLKTAPGVRVLRDYLSYAREGRLERGITGDGEAESPFEASVANALRARGHNVALQVGVAGYRIDLAVRHPEMPEHFVLGIECDGAAYHSAKSARDRDRLRQEALERLGWRLTRVWSTDWFRDPVSQAERLSTEIVAAVRSAHAGPERRRYLVELKPPSSQVPPETAPIATADPRHDPHAEERPLLPPVVGALPAGSTLEFGPATQTTAAEPEPRPDLATALRHLREGTIMRELPGSEPGRCILRDPMIDLIVRTGLDDPADFHSKIPEWLRAGTDGRQTRYLERICDVVTEHLAGLHPI
jgi:very-short-patch-repair endonuclease